MALRRGVCTNVGKCSVADAHGYVDLPIKAAFRCLWCKAPLTEIARPKEFPTEAVVTGGLILVLLLVIGLGVGPMLAPKMRAGISHPSSDRIVLKIHGSNTIGAQLGPNLAADFFKAQGATGVKIVPATADAYTIEGVLPGDTSPKFIEIQAHGSATGFADLKAGTCDIGMASRPIKADEAKALAGIGYGEMTAASSEHVLGVDGIAVIVNPANPITALTKEQIAQIFTGTVTDWSAVHGSHGTINIYARDDKSGTYDTFKTLVLGSTPLVPTARRIEDSRELSDRVASDPQGIGFIGLPYIKDAKAIAVSDNGTRTLMPNRLTVATEDYLLSRRLFLYTPAVPANALTRKFVDFALSKQGQEVVESNGFVGQNVQTTSSSISGDAPGEYRKLTQSAQRMSLNFRFLPGSSTLDNKAITDLDRVVSFLVDTHYAGQKVMLFGFSDSNGTKQSNDALSKERARVVAQQFSQRGVSPEIVTGFGSELPIASNTSEDGRSRNRRVEIWLAR